MDANANRAAEGLRTLEDVARLHCENESAVRVTKELRHRLGELLSSIDRTKRLQIRSTERDAGTAVTSNGEVERQDLTSLVPAACERVTQALRQLEECGKLLMPEVAEQFKQLRYAAYDQLAQIELWLVHGVWDPASAHVYLLMDCALPLEQFVAYVAELHEAGVDVFQLRDKNADGAQLVQYARAFKAIAAESQPRLVINDRVDVALAVAADGVHVGQEDMSIADVRAVAGRRLVVGVSTHNLDQALAAQADGADYLGCGPTFPSGTKRFNEFPGPSFLREVASTLRTPAFAIGGIDVNNVQGVVDSGFNRIAISGVVHRSENPEQAVRELKQCMLVSTSSSIG